MPKLQCGEDDGVGAPRRECVRSVRGDEVAPVAGERGRPRQDGEGAEESEEDHRGCAWRPTTRDLEV